MGQNKLEAYRYALRNIRKYKNNLEKNFAKNYMYICSQEWSNLNVKNITRKSKAEEKGKYIISDNDTCCFFLTR